MCCGVVLKSLTVRLRRLKLNILLIIAALVCFLIGAFGEPYLPRVRVGWLGLAFYMIYLLMALLSGHR